MNIKSLGDITNSPARTSSLVRETLCELPAGQYQLGGGTHRTNVANDQAVMVPSASSESIAVVDCAIFLGLSDMSWSSKFSAIWRVWSVAVDHTMNE